MTDTKSRSAPDYAAAAVVVRDLFGMGCENPRPLGITLTPTPCGECRECKRDWTPEARMIVDAAQNQPSTAGDQ